jgi:hypothetical protein
MLLRLFLLFQLMRTFTHFKSTNAQLILKTLKNILKNCPYVFRSIFTTIFRGFMRPLKMVVNMYRNMYGKFLKCFKNVLSVLSINVN